MALSQVYQLFQKTVLEQTLDNFLIFDTLIYFQSIGSSIRFQFRNRKGIHPYTTKLQNRERKRENSECLFVLLSPYFVFHDFVSGVVPSFSWPLFKTRSVSISIQMKESVPLPAIWQKKNTKVRDAWKWMLNTCTGLNGSTSWERG